MLLKQAFNDKVVIAHCLVQYWQIFSSFLIFCCYFTRLKAREISYKIWETRKIFPILHSSPHDNNYIFSSFLIFSKFLIFCKIWKTRKILAILHSAPCNNNFLNSKVLVLLSMRRTSRVNGKSQFKFKSQSCC